MKSVFDLPPAERIREMGYRHYIGGEEADSWFGIGLLQYQFLIAHGLLPEHRFLDIACGALRLGQFLIPYLNQGHYFGLEAEESLVEAGLSNELKFDLLDLKEPKFGFGYDFDFSFVTGFDFAIAQSLFTHLVQSDIYKCFENLRPKAQDHSQFYLTFFEGSSNNNPDGPSHANHCWFYSFEELQALANQANWSLTYIGPWQHPRNQMMALAEPI